VLRVVLGRDRLELGVDRGVTRLGTHGVEPDRQRGVRLAGLDLQRHELAAQRHALLGRRRREHLTVEQRPPRRVVGLTANGRLEQLRSPRGGRTSPTRACTSLRRRSASSAA